MATEESAPFGKDWHPEGTGALAWWQAAAVTFALAALVLGGLLLRATWPQSTHLSSLYIGWTGEMTPVAYPVANAGTSEGLASASGHNQRAEGLVYGFQWRSPPGHSDTGTLLDHLTTINAYVDRMLSATMSERGAARRRDARFVSDTLRRSLFARLPQRAAGTPHSPPTLVQPNGDQSAIGLSDRLCQAMVDVERGYYGHFVQGGPSAAVQANLQNACMNEPTGGI